MLVGSFYSEGTIGKDGLPEGWMKTSFLVIMFIGIIVIFLNALKNDAGQTWLDYSLDYLQSYWSSTAVASVILIILVVLFVVYLTRSPKDKDKK